MSSFPESILFLRFLLSSGCSVSFVRLLLLLSDFYGEEQNEVGTYLARGDILGRDR